MANDLWVSNGDHYYHIHAAIIRYTGIVDPYYRGILTSKLASLPSVGAAYSWDLVHALVANAHYGLTFTETIIQYPEEIIQRLSERWRDYGHRTERPAGRKQIKALREWWAKELETGQAIGLKQSRS
jgi:hypothetical protein